MASRLAWFTTPYGRWTMGSIASIATCGTFAITFLPNTICVNSYLEFVEMRKLDKPVCLQPKVKKLWETVLDDLNFDDAHKEIIKPFTVFGFDVWHAGSLKSKFGSIIGLPINFTYTNIAMIDKDQIIINEEPVDWGREDAKQLLNSMVLSDKAQKYAMAREILMTNNYHIYIKAVSNGLIIGASYVFGAQLNQVFKMFEKPRSLRVFVYLFTTAFSWGIWAVQNDSITRHYEHEVDEYLSQMGADYIEGAIEFYNKLLERNIAQRTLFGSIGKRTYTARGNEAYFIRMKNLPLTHRKKFFEDKLKSLESTIMEKSEEVHFS